MMKLQFHFISFVVVTVGNTTMAVGPSGTVKE